MNPVTRFHVLPVIWQIERKVITFGHHRMRWIGWPTTHMGLP